MRVVREMKIPPKFIAEKVRKVESFICDIETCDNVVIRSSYGGGGGRCDICERDLCVEHKIWDDNGSDYPDFYCASCHDIFIPALREMKQRHEDEEEALREKVKKESLNVGKTREA